MKLSTLKRAIENAIISDPEANADDLLNLLKARDELVALTDICEDGTETLVSVVSEYALSNLLNVSTYDIFGRIRKMYRPCPRTQARLYQEAIWDNICEELTPRQINDAADFLSDLWDDNEANGCHNPDGSFKQDSPCDHLAARVAELETIINKLYHHRGLSADDLSAIQTIIH